ncbi:GntR family transcriptional regulator [Roseateles sp. LKC17W]|uniref:GntR family transcriptional regulator n=1 Tax=Pelomonas margarita TaxID=3299031 RepID=A0ABW7FPQ0_9BURK
MDDDFSERAALPVEHGGDRKAQLVETLRRRILSLELKPGAIVDEVELGAEFGLSRPPVRELLRQMAAEGYLELAPNRATRVSALSYESIRSFFQCAPVIYSATTQLAAERATPADVARLRAIQARFKEAIAAHDIDLRIHCNDQFHLEIGKIANNAHFMPSLQRVLLDHARLGKIFHQPSPSAEKSFTSMAVHEHDLIIDAIERQDASAAVEIIRTHMELSRRRMSSYAMPDFLNIPLAS